MALLLLVRLVVDGVSKDPLHVELHNIYALSSFLVKNK